MRGEVGCVVVVVVVVVVAVAVAVEESGWRLAGGGTGGNFYKNESRIQKATYGASSNQRRLRSRIWPNCSTTTASLSSLHSAWDIIARPPPAHPIDPVRWVN